MNRRSWRTFTRDVLRSRGYDLNRFSRMQILRDSRIDLILDVGANTGQFATQSRRLGFGGHIISFEPLDMALPELRARADGDDRWEVRPWALGDSDGHTTINVSRNLVSSSVLDIRSSLTDVDPGSAFQSQQVVVIRRLDSVFDDLVPPGARVLLKVDTQGYERQVFAGAQRVLPRINALHFEVSLVELYKGEMLIGEAIEMLERNGYQLANVEPSLPDPVTGQLLQVDLTATRWGPET